jgi:tetratricopeptide (TPR) repeat protein
MLKISQTLIVALFFCVAFLDMQGGVGDVKPIEAKDKVEKLIRIADGAYDDRDFEKALQLYRKILELDPENAIAMFQQEATKSALGQKVDCDKVKKSIELGFPAGDFELKFFNCL